MDLLAKVLVISLLTSSEVLSQSYLSDVLLSPCCTQAVGANVSASVVASNPDVTLPPLSINWKLNGVSVATVNYFEDSITYYYVPDSLYKGRVHVSGSKASDWKINVTSVLTLINLQTNDNLLSANIDNTSKNTTLNVKECPSSLSYNVTVDAASFTYGSSGTFSCPSNSELFHSNGTLVTSSSIQTQCLADATWSQQEYLECWNAPSVKLYPENISGNENDIISLSCQAFGGFPSPYLYEFVVLSNTTAKPSTNISIKLRREWNQQETYCKAITKYTALNDKGKSLSKKMNVLYAPFAESSSEVKCEWSLNQLNPVCDVPFYSNPTPVVVSLIKGEKNLTGPLYQLLNTDVKDRYIFSLQRRTVLEEDFGQYIVTLSNSMNKSSIKFSVVQSTSSQVNVGVIVGSVFGSLAAVALIAVGVCAVLWHQAKKTKDGKLLTNQDGKLDSNTSPLPVVYINDPKTEIGQVQDHTGGDSVTFNQQAAATAYENVHHYEAVGANKQEGGEDSYIDFNI